MSVILDTVISGVLPGIDDAKTAVLAVMGAMVVFAASAWGVLRILRLLYVSGGEDFKDRIGETNALLDNEYEQALGYAEDPDETPGRNAEAWGEIADFLQADPEYPDGPDAAERQERKNAEAEQMLRDLRASNDSDGFDDVDGERA